MSDTGKPLDRWLVAHPVSVAVSLLLVAFLGSVATLRLPIQLTPDLADPAVSLSVAWPGAAPDEIESEILKPLEEVLNDIPGLERLESSANFASGTVQLEFSVETDPDAAIVQVANRLASVTDLPEDATPPRINPANASGPPLAVVTLSAQAGADIGRYRAFADEQVVPQLGRIPGVAQVSLVGGQDAELQVDLDPYKLARAGLSLGTLQQALSGVLSDRSAGAIEQGKRRYLVRTELDNARAEELEQLVVGTDPQGGPISLGALGEARAGFRRSASVTYINEAPALIMLMFRQPGYNVLDTTRALIERIDELRPEMARAGLDIRLIFDQREYIEGSLAHVTQNLGVGALLATLILLFFLRSWRSAALVAGAIPACLAATGMGLLLLGRSLNVISIAGVTFAVGMVLDNAIVVVEAVSYWRKRGFGGRDASLKASAEVGAALVASTLTSLVVFLPLLAWVGQAAQLIADLAVAISLALAASLLYSRLVVPSLAAALWREGSQAERTQPPTESLAKHRFWLDSRTGRGLFAWGAPIFALLLAAALFPALEYLPTGNRKLIFGVLVPPPGYGVPEIKRLARYHQHALEPLRTPEPSEGKLRRAFFVGSPGSIFAGVVTWDTAGIQPAVGEVQRVHARIPGTFSVVRQSSLFSRRLGGGRSVQLDLLGSEPRALEAGTQALMGALRKTLPGAQLRPIPDLGAKSLELRVRPELARLSSNGLDAMSLATYTAAAVDGAFVGEVTPEGGFRRDVVLRLRPPSRPDWPDTMSAEDLANLPLVNAAGQTVALGDVARSELVTSPTSIRRIDEARAITLQVSPPEGVPLEEALRQTRLQVKVLRDAGTLPPSVQARISGSASDLDEAKDALFITLAFAFLVTYLLLAALLEHFRAPFPIIVSVPLAACGGIAGFRLVSATIAEQSLDIFSGAGFLMLIGLVVNNAILLVDAALAGHAQGRSARDAVAGAVSRRLRPILMTASTSVVGLAPLVFYNGTGSELYRGIGSIVLGGMLLSTAITLLTTPALLLSMRLLRDPKGRAPKAA